MTAKFVNDEHQNTRFGDSNPLGKLLAEKVFGSEDLRAAVKNFDAEVRSYDLTPIEVAMRWIAHHSALQDDDGIILGASRIDQVVETIGMIRKGPLSQEMLVVTEKAWTAVEATRGQII